MLEELKRGLRESIRKLIRSDVVDRETIRSFITDVQRALLQSDVSVKVVYELSKRIEERASKIEEAPAGFSKKDLLLRILYEELSNILGEEADLPTFWADRLNKILLVGIQGSGKTTVAAKLAKAFSRRGYRVGLICADTFRPGAYAQLKMLVEKLDLEVYHESSETSSVKIARNGIEYFRVQGKNLVIIDTAGRHKEEKGLMEEMRQLCDAVNPTLTLLVIDGTIGQRCYSQAEAFHKVAPLGGIVITKMDGTARGGGALAASAATGARVMFIGSGERLDDLEPFFAKRFARRLLGFGDFEALLGRLKEVEAQRDEEMGRRLLSGKMTIDDLYYQLEKFRRLGSVRKILELLPGFAVPDIDFGELDKRIDRWRYAVQSMSKEERRNPEIINAQRIYRISRGSGVSEKEIRELLKHYGVMKRLLKTSKDRTFRMLMGRFMQK